MLKGIIRFSILLAVFAVNAAQAQEYFTLYGYKIGQSISQVKKELGKPVQVHKFKDGWTAYSYQLKGHNAHFETGPQNPNAILSIQIEGYTNPRFHGLGLVNLGDSAASALKILGKPKQNKESQDLTTREKVSDTRIHFYEGYSFEEKDGKVSSIKVIYEKQKEALPVPDYSRLFKALENKDYYTLAEMISVNLRSNDKPVITGAIVKDLQQGTLHDIFYDKKGNLKFTQKQHTDGAMRMTMGVGVGHVAKFSKAPIHEMVFYPSYDGMVLTEIW